MATGKSDDELLQHDNKLRIGTRSGKFRKSRIIYGFVTKHNANANDNIHACVTLHDTDVNDNIYDCVALHDTYTTTKRERAFPLVCQRSVVSHHSHTHRGSSSKCLRHSPHLHVHGHLCVLFTLTLPFYFLHFLTSLTFFLQFQKHVVNLHNSANESMDSTDEFSLSTGYEPKAYDFNETSVEPYMQLLDSPPSPTKSLLRTPTTMTLHSKTCSTKHIERKPITLFEKTCLSVCPRRQCPIERGDPLEIDRGDSVSTETQKHRLGLCSTIKKCKFLQSAKQELINTNFKQLEPKKINNFFKDNYCSKIWNYVKLIKEVSLKWKS